MTCEAPDAATGIFEVSERILTRYDQSPIQYTRPIWITIWVRVASRAQDGYNSRSKAGPNLTEFARGRAINSGGLKPCLPRVFQVISQDSREDTKKPIMFAISMDTIFPQPQSPSNGFTDSSSYLLLRSPSASSLFSTSLRGRNRQIPNTSDPYNSSCQ